ncbi:hypothetical protein [Actinomadura hibisca]|uniref:hypothetical protein n=1 Tax=Actinomadura hibisca TaxID=68565 RepID=UPI0008342186|nr:hypothetical protein [Actinomadura hibisca]
MLDESSVSDQWWYRSSAGRLLARCPDAATAIARITELVAPLVAGVFFRQAKREPLSIAEFH